jgi:hypothetical protein
MRAGTRLAQRDARRLAVLGLGGKGNVFIPCFPLVPIVAFIDLPDQNSGHASTICRALIRRVPRDLPVSFRVVDDERSKIVHRVVGESGASYIVVTKDWAGSRSTRRWLRDATVLHYV